MLCGEPSLGKCRVKLSVEKPKRLSEKAWKMNREVNTHAHTHTQTPLGYALQAQLRMRSDVNGILIVHLGLLYRRNNTA